MSNPEASDSPLATVSTTASPLAVFNPYSFVGSRDDLRKRVAQEREKHHQLVHDSLATLNVLHKVHNSLAPVNSLPPELLGLVFSHLVSHGDLRTKPSNSFPYTSQRDPDGRFIVDPPSGHSDVVRVSHVCKYWQTVAIRNPWLWTSLPIHQPIAFHLSRSKNLPLSLSLTSRFSSDAAPRLWSSICHIRSLFIETPLADDIELLWHELSRPAPNLEELFIQHLKRTNYLDGFAVGKSGRLPPLFNGETPSLRILALRGVPSPFELFPASLIHLDLGNGGPLPPFADLLKMLRNCPLLETLNVCGAWDWDEVNDHVLVRNSVALPKLARIHLQIWPERAYDLFLSSFSLPQHTDVTIASTVEEPGDLELMFLTIRPPFIPPCFTGFRRLHLMRERTDGRLHAFRSADAISEFPALDIDCRDAWAHPHPAWAGFFFDWPFDASQIETLVVAQSPTRSHPAAEGESLRATNAKTFEEWVTTFQQLPALKTVRAIGLPKVELELLIDALDTWGFPAMTVACPGLTTLEIFDAEDMSGMWDDLLGMLDRRRTQGGTLQQVELFNCKRCDYKYLLSRLGELGVELVVDGETIEPPEPGSRSSSPSDLGGFALGPWLLSCEEVLL